MAEAQKTTLNGSCKCGFVKYKANVKLEADGGIQATRCNCTFCTKTATTNVTLGGASDFFLLEPDNLDKLGAFAINPKTGYRHFCTKCGCQIVAFAGWDAPDGTRHELVSLNLSSIDQPQGEFDLKKAKIQYYNGLTDRQYVDGLGKEPFEHGLI